MRGTVSFHPVDMQLFDELILPLLAGSKVNPEKYLAACLRHKLITGVCTSLCQNNIDDLLTEAWVDRVIDMGAMYLWYHTYRTVGPDPQPELAFRS